MRVPICTRDILDGDGRATLVRRIISNFSVRENLIYVPAISHDADEK